MKIYDRTYKTATRSIQANPFRSDRLSRFLLEVEPRWRTNVAVCWSRLLLHGFLCSFQIISGFAFYGCETKIDVLKDDIKWWPKAVTKMVQGEAG